MSNSQAHTFSSAPMSLALGRKDWTSFSFACPELAGTSVFNDINHLLEVHVRHASEPMHQPLHLWLVAHFIAHTIKDAIEKYLRLSRAAKRGGVVKASCINSPACTGASAALCVCGCPGRLPTKRLACCNRNLWWCHCGCCTLPATTLCRRCPGRPWLLSCSNLCWRHCGSPGRPWLLSWNCCLWHCGCPGRLPTERLACCNWNRWWCYCGCCSTLPATAFCRGCPGRPRLLS